MKQATSTAVSRLFLVTTAPVDRSIFESHVERAYALGLGELVLDRRGDVSSNVYGMPQATFLVRGVEASVLAVELLGRVWKGGATVREITDEAPVVLRSVDVFREVADTDFRFVSRWSWRRTRSGPEAYVASHNGATCALVVPSHSGQGWRAQVRGVEIVDCPTVDNAQTVAEVLAALVSGGKA